MANDDTLSFDVTADTTGLDSKLKKAKASLGDFAKEADRQAGAAKSAINKHLHEVDGGGLSYLEKEVLGHVGRATFESLAAGANPLRVLAQEGLKATSVIGEGGLTGLVGRLGVSLGGLISPATLAGGAIVAAGAIGLKAYTDYEAELQKVRVGLAGVGQASHATVDDIEEIGDAIAKNSSVSRTAGRDIALSLAQTGKIDKSQIASIGELAKGYAILSGQSPLDAGKDLAKIFSDPAKGADTLNERLADLDGETVHYIKSLAASGDVQKAQQVLFDATSADIRKATTYVSGLTQTYDRFNNAIEARVRPGVQGIGAAIASIFEGTSIKDKIAEVEAALSRAQQAQQAFSTSGVFGGQARAQQAEAEAARLKEQLALLKEQKTATDNVTKANADKAKAVVDQGPANAIIHPADPQLQAIQQTQQQRDVVGLAIRDSLQTGKLTEGGFKEALATYDALDAKLKDLKSDYAAGGTAAAAALRQADFSKATAGLSSYAAALERINFELAETKRRAEGTVNAQATISTAETEAAAKRSALTTQYLAQPSQYSHSISEVPAQYRDLVLAAAQRNNIDPNLFASLGFAESSFVNGQTSPTGNKGLYQLGRGVIHDQGVTDVFDPAQNINAGAAYFAQQLKRYNQEPAAAIAAYHDGHVDRGDISTAGQKARDEVAAITQQTAGVKQQADASRDADRAIDDQAKSLANLQANLGKSNVALAAAEEAQRLESAAVRAGIPLTDSLKKSIQERAAATADLAQKTAGVKLGADRSFQREELGLSPDQAAVAQQLHGAGIDANSDAGRQLAAQIQDIRNITDVKDTGSSFAKGLTQDLIAGTRAGQALENQLQRILGKLSDNLIDNLFSTAINGLLKSGGGGILSSIGGLLSGGALHLAGGGRVVGAGSGTSDSIPAFLSHGEFVMNAAATRKHGSLFAAMNSGTVLRLAAGGPVGMSAMPVAVAPGGMSATTQHNVNIHLHGAVGNEEVRAMARQGGMEAMAAYDRRMESGSIYRQRLADHRRRT